MTIDESESASAAKRPLVVVFSLIVIAAMVVRLIVIRYTADPGWIDLKIYRSAGALTNAGINPFDSKKVLTDATAEAIRTDPRFFDVWASDLSRWDYYVSGNPPLSVLYWAALEWLGRGTTRAYQLIFALMDVAIFVLAVLLHNRITGKLRSRDLLGLAFLTVFNPLLLWWGTWLPEDKQLQTAIVLGLLLLINTSRYFRIGLVSGCLVLFKAVGLPLVVVAVYKVVKKRSWRSIGKFVGGGLVPTIASLGVFGWVFLDPMWSRLTAQADTGPIHDSMWVAVPSGYAFRTIAALLFVAVGVVWALVAVAAEWRSSFIALWLSLALVMIVLTAGSWDRQLMALIPVYVLVYGCIDRARPWIVAQAVLVGWTYFWWVWLGPKVGPTPTLDVGALCSLLSILLLLITAVGFAATDPMLVPVLRRRLSSISSKLDRRQANKKHVEPADVESHSV